MSRFDDALESANSVQVSSRSCLNVYRQGALMRRLEFLITPEHADRLFRSPCHYCGFHPKHKFNGIDRVDNKIGYIESNVVACCQWCNRAKGRFALNDFMEWLNWVRATPSDAKEVHSKLDDRPRLHWHDVAVGGETIQILMDNFPLSGPMDDLGVAPKSEWQPPKMPGISMKEYVRRQVWGK